MNKQNKTATRPMQEIYDVAERNLPLSQKEIAALLGVCQRTIQIYTRQGMPCFFTGKLQRQGKGSRPRYFAKDCIAWLEQRSMLEA